MAERQRNRERQKHNGRVERVAGDPDEDVEGGMNRQRPRGEEGVGEEAAERLRPARLACGEYQRERDACQCHNAGRKRARAVEECPKPTFGAEGKRQEQRRADDHREPETLFAGLPAARELHPSRDEQGCKQCQAYGEADLAEATRRPKPERRHGEQSECQRQTHTSARSRREGNEQADRDGEHRPTIAVRRRHLRHCNDQTGEEPEQQSVGGEVGRAERRLWHHRKKQGTQQRSAPANPPVKQQKARRRSGHNQKQRRQPEAELAPAAGHEAGLPQKRGEPRPGKERTRLHRRKEGARRSVSQTACQCRRRGLPRLPEACGGCRDQIEQGDEGGDSCGHPAAAAA